ncbi:pyrimidine/purine nucleoside phosphorylase [Vibrio rhizosphaerae]|uniref:Pyrimidine/purine nucleoside phosphorylase n=1 Tax=Vibrio rhizosphaerae TaxID=398736 RepID=A0ABU4IQ31_9VIBR|nr:pyrimidine/purine nucleoside phosphorylase [Vibrio rhizosphaerae]MDW6091073.1 pyrimidine/purine nucleoside phosphorylase [Vibrio rhizosphaerae]
MQEFEELKYVQSFIFFDGRSLIREFVDQAGCKISYGFMLKGKFIWKATGIEKFSIFSGEAIFIYEGATVSVRAGEHITIPDGVEFVVEVNSDLDYRCDYE